MELTGMRVLVVEDEVMISMLMEEFLLDLGCDVAGTALSLDEALEKAGTLAIDVGLLDVNLGSKASYSVAELLRARHIPFVFATGYSVAGLASALQFAPVLSKPFRQAQLALALQQATSGHEEATRH